MVMAELETRSIDLAIQLFLLLMLILAYLMVRTRKNMKIHAWLFLSLTLVNIASVLLIMVPAFLAESEEIVATPFTEHSIIMWTHHLIGLLAIALSIYILARWGVGRKKFGPCGGKLIMRFAYSTWFLSIILGLILYVLESG